MPYKSRLAGDANSITTPGTDKQPHKLKTLVHGDWLPGVACDMISIQNNNSSGGGNILVGPNGKAQFKLVPGSDVTITKVVPGEVAINDLGVSAAVSYVFGGEPAGD